MRDGGKVLGIHFLGPNAGEVVQGFAAAMRSEKYLSKCYLII